MIAEIVDEWWNLEFFIRPKKKSTRWNASFVCDKPIKVVESDASFLLIFYQNTKLAPTRVISVLLDIQLDRVKQKRN